MGERFSWSRLIVALAIIAAGISGTASAAVTGKIAGRVVGAADAAPIPGAAVTIEGLRLGASTDEEGRYFIIGVQPGTYTVTAALVGYAPMTKTRVLVNIDHTTPIDFILTESAIEIEGVTAIAEREVIQLDVAGSRSTLTAEDVLDIPTTASLSGAIGRETGVSGLQIRGGQAEETQLLLNGHSMGDMRLRTYSTDFLSVTSVQEVQVLKSGFNAEYGNVRSGVINVVTRDDVQRLWFNSRSTYAPPQSGLLSEDPLGRPLGEPFGTSTTEYKVYGAPYSIDKPYSIPNLATRTILNDSILVFRSWYGYTSTRDTPAKRRATAEQMRQFWLHRHGYNIDATQNTFEDAWASKPGYTIDASIGGPVPLLSGLSFTYSHRNTYSPYMMLSARRSYNDYTEQGTLTYRLGPAKISATGMYHSERGIGYADLTSLAKGGWGPGASATTKYAIYRGSPIDNWSALGGLTFTHAISANTQYELAMDWQKNRYTLGTWPDRYINVVENGVSKRVPNPLWLSHTLEAAGRDTTGKGWPLINPVDPYGIAPFGHQGDAISYSDGGDERAGLKYDLGQSLDNQDSSYWSALKFRGFVLSQVTQHNQLKAGFELSLLSLHDRMNFEVKASSIAWQWYNETPLEAAAYIQDKIEYEGMIMNVGLRVDHFNPRTNVYLELDDEGNSNIHMSRSRLWEKGWWPYFKDHDLWNWLDTNQVHMENSLKHYTIARAKSRTKLAPRLSISHPISASSKVFFNYGHFYQNPRASTYFGGGGLISAVYGYRYGPTGTGVSPIPAPEADFPRTIQYELGLEREFSNWLWAWALGSRPEPQFLVSVAGYYKDITREIGQTGYFMTGTDIVYRDENKRYAQIRGVEGRIHKRVGNFFTGWIQGDLALWDYGAVGFTQRDSVDDNKNVPESAYQVTSVAEPLFSLNLDLHTPRSFSPFGIPAPITQLWTAILAVGYRQGGQFVYNPSNLIPPPALNARTRDSWSSSLTLAKGFSLKSAVGEVSLSIGNILGYKSFGGGGLTATEYQEYLRSLHFPIKDTSIETDYGNDRVGDYPDYAFMPTHDNWANWSGARSYTFALNLSIN